MISDKNDMSDENVEIKPFSSRNEGFILVHKKTERLASAIYLVTNLLSDSEPMKWNLRKKSTELLSLIITYRDISLSYFPDYLHDVRTRVLELVSMLEICQMGGLISQMNFSVLKKEFSNLIVMLNMPQDNLLGTANHDISNKFFEISEGEKNEASSVAEYPIQVRREPPELNRTLKDISAGSSVVFRGSNRQNIIMGLLKKKKDLTIKDISQVIRDCSEKTIQRELSSLVIAGVVSKIGERRWSRYSLSSGQ